MSNNVRLEVLLSAVDRASRPLKAIQTASKSLTGDIRNSQKSLRDLNAQASRIDGFRKASSQLAVTGQSLNKAKQEAAALAVQFKNTGTPTLAQARALEAAKKSAAELQLKYNGLRQSVQRQRTELTQAGINTRQLSTDERGLRSRISETTAQLNRQREALAKVSAQQARLSQVKERYQAGKSLAGSMAGVGAAGVGIATTGTVAGVKLMMPGFDFAQKNSELQAVLGVEKQSPEMQALRKQARQLGDNTAASADDAASAQIIIAKSGGDAAAIQAATPVTLNMALSNKRTMEENAALLTGMKSAFQLSNDKVAHIGDVLSMTMNKTAADFDGMSDALTYAAPVAKNAGVSIEETAAMVGALHDSKITGSMAGTGSRAVLSRLQAPTGKPIPQMTVERGDGDRHQFAIADREAYTGVTAKWLHTKDPKPQKQKVKLKRKPKVQHLRALQHPKAAKTTAKAKAKKEQEAREGEYMAGEADNVLDLTTIYATKAQAMRAAQAKWDKIQRGVAEFSISLAIGRADLFPETPVAVKGFKRVIDEQAWIISRVVHSLNGNGYTTGLELEVKISDVEYVAEED